MPLDGDVSRPRLRIQVRQESDPRFAGSVIATYGKPGTEFFAKEWSISEDIMNVADSACVTLANDAGQLNGLLRVGQRVDISLQDDAVGELFAPQLTGRILRRTGYSDEHGGSNVMLEIQDLGWHLVNCEVTPHVNLLGLTFDQLLSHPGIIDPKWGLNTIVDSDIANRRLKQGRAGVDRLIRHKATDRLPPIQTEIGQHPFDIIRTYAQREGLLVNVGVNGEILLFSPNYDNAQYAFDYHGDANRQRNNMLGAPTISESIDGLYSQSECWSMAVGTEALNELATGVDFNALFRQSDTIKYTTNPLPFSRPHYFMDPEAISPGMRNNRATYALQVGKFASWSYTFEALGVSQGGIFFASGTMASLNDSVNGIANQAYYIQRIQKSHSVREGVRTRFLMRKPVLNPTLLTFAQGGTTQSSQ